MTESELALFKEGLQLADDALARIMEVNNEEVKHIANLLHCALVFGEKLLDL